ncbi:MAG: endonuclease/exonuclease/phosphatase family protein [Deltaproteobacteria bacterium]|nr:endonuclease/exonuclease/phosphatase family protein [Deltaproteobacteria bacterium]
MPRALAVIVVMLVVACREDAPALTTPGRLRVMSYNLNFGLAGDRAGAAAIARAQPDVVVLQESNDAWRAALVRDLAGRFPHHRFTHQDDWAAGGLGILSKFPIRSIDELPSAVDHFVAWRAVIDTPLGAIQVLDVHLRPPRSDRGSVAVGYFSTRGDRAREIERHLAALAPMPTIIAGDFNEEADGLASARLRAVGYRDAIADRFGPAPTWAWELNGVTLRYQLDHVFYDAAFTAHDAAIVDAGRSDHRPIWADLAPTAR